MHLKKHSKIAPPSIIQILEMIEENIFLEKKIVDDTIGDCKMIFWYILT